MKRYFIDSNGRCAGECIVENPANPDNLQIIANAEIVGNQTDYVLDSGVLVYSPSQQPTTEQIIEGFKSAIQNTLDNAARSNNYDDIVSACSYAGYPNVFQAEAIAFGQWRANVWVYGYAELDKVIAGTRPVPTIPEIIAELPELVLP